MAKIKPEDLGKISEKIKRTILLREGSYRIKIIVHMGTCGIAAGARKIMTAFLNEINNKDVKDILLTNSSCAGLCSHEPMITVELPDQPPIKYVTLTPEKVKTIFEKHILGGNIVTEYALSVGSERQL
ncbi:MAG: (2Fe-2S) ferredoxin domain-containing protein [Candidatus Cloacimonadota bacterium]|nr:MAG: (2Fe-2S) ferredoxin domain-containing protein [Candidatus Cloacimonadota bacterium]